MKPTVAPVFVGIGIVVSTWTVGTVAGVDLETICLTLTALLGLLAAGGDMSGAEKGINAWMVGVFFYSLVIWIDTQITSGPLHFLTLSASFGVLRSMLCFGEEISPLGYLAAALVGMSMFFGVANSHWTCDLCRCVPTFGMRRPTV